MQIEIELRSADCNVMEPQILAFAQLVIVRLGCDWQIAMSHNLRYWHCTLWCSLSWTCDCEIELWWVSPAWKKNGPWWWDQFLMGELLSEMSIFGDYKLGFWWVDKLWLHWGGWTPLWNVDIWLVDWVLMGWQTVIALRWHQGWCLASTTSRSDFLPSIPPQQKCFPGKKCQSKEQTKWQCEHRYQVYGLHKLGMLLQMRIPTQFGSAPFLVGRDFVNTQSLFLLSLPSVINISLRHLTFLLSCW